MFIQALEAGKKNVRECLANAPVVRGRTEPHAYRTLVAHVGGPAARPLRLDVYDFAPNALVEAIHEQRHADIDHLRDEGVFLLVRSMFLDLGEDERVAALDRFAGQSRHLESW